MASPPPSPRKAECQNSELNDEESRQRALDEADAVLQAVGGDHYLDGFNLLGVVANPRGTSYLSGSFHGRYNTPSNISSTHGMTMSTASNATSTASDAFLADTYQSLESTLTQVTEQMDAWNHWLDDWSRQILESAHDDSAGEELPESQLRELPEPLRDLDLAPLQKYLETCGKGAHQFSRRIVQQQNESAAATASEAALDIPDIFFQETLDLTDPQTFRDLVLEEDASVVIPENEDADDDRPIAEWFPLLPADSFGTSLDQVELALLQQVRSKSGDFFAESLRFAQLQQGMDEVVQQVMQLQAAIEHLQADWVDPMKTVPILDQQRVDLRLFLQVLDETDDLLQSKTSLAGVLSAQDDLTAIAQIQYGRKLLASSLQKVQALSGVAQQLNQYEQLVVTNLREELIEIFMSWNAPGSVYSPSNSSSNVRDRVKEIVMALRECNALDATREAYSNRLQDMIRMTVRTTVGEFAAEDGSAGTVPVSMGTTAMSLTRFLDCLDMLFEQLLALLNSADGIDGFCATEGFFEQEGDKSVPQRPMANVVASAADLSSKSVSELLRLRKEAHSLVTLQEMKSIWDACLAFTTTIERMSGRSSTLRSTLLAQAKAFVERKHESNMSALVAALDSELWKQCDVSVERQEALTRLCAGRSLVTTTPTNSSLNGGGSMASKNPEIEVEGARYKVVWSCLLLVEMITTNIASAAHFPSLASGIVGKISELLRLFNSRTTHLVLLAGAMHSNAKLKSINAKHLSLVAQCLGMIIAILPHVRAALMAQLPKKQHTLLNDIYQIRKEYADHNEKVLNKFVTIIGGIVEHGLAPKIAGTDFDKRASATGSCAFLGGVATNTKKMHHVLKGLLPPEHLRDVFSRIFAFVDTKVPVLLISSADKEDINFALPQTDDGKKQLLTETESMITALNGLDGVLPWDFTAVTVLARKMDYRLEADKTVEKVEREETSNEEKSNDEKEDKMQSPPPAQNAESPGANGKDVNEDKMQSPPPAKDEDPPEANVNGIEEDEDKIQPPPPSQDEESFDAYSNNEDEDKIQPSPPAQDEESSDVNGTSIERASHERESPSPETQDASHENEEIEAKEENQSSEES